MRKKRILEALNIMAQFISSLKDYSTVELVTATIPEELEEIEDRLGDMLIDVNEIDLSKLTDYIKWIQENVEDD